MIREEYKRAFADILPDPALEAQTERMATQMFMKNTRPARRFSAVLVAAIVFVLAASIAVAATIQSGILNHLFIYDEPSEAAQKAVVHGGESATDEGVTLAITEYLMDSNTLHVAWNVTSERDEPVYYTTDYELIDSQTANEQDDDNSFFSSRASEGIGDTVLTQLTPEQASHADYMGRGYRSAPDSPVTVKIRVRAFTTKLTPVEMRDDLLIPITAEEQRDYQAMATANQIGVTADGRSRLNEYAAYKTALEKLLAERDSTYYPDGDRYDRIHEDALVESGLMQPLTELVCTVSVPVQTSDPANSAGTGESEFILPDRKVVIREFSMDVASTVLSYDIYPDDESTWDGNWMGNGWWYLLVDAEGNVLNPAIGLNISAHDNEESRGEGEPLCIHVDCDGNPAPEIPEYVTFVPTCALERKENESSFDYYARMAALADPADCFRVNLAGGE